MRLPRSTYNIAASRRKARLWNEPSGRPEAREPRREFMEKRDSIFSGLNPAALPLPPATAPSPAVPAQEVSELNKKIDAMEANLSARLDEKIGLSQGALVPPSESPAPASGVPAQEVLELNKKMDALEANLSARLEEKIGQCLAALVPPAPAPAVPAQEVLELNKKMDAMEANLSVRLEEKIGQCLGALLPAPPAPAPAVPAQEVLELNKKMDAMEANLSVRLEEKIGQCLGALVPAPPASAPAVSAREVSELNRKIDAMEGTLLARLEEKIGQCLSVPPPPAPGHPEMSSQFLLSRISELDGRLEEFTRRAMASSVQMKNIEESKISARREIEELLKVVREQQKYSELDRQIHDQLERSWRRVEELEKKLMDFYGTISKRPEPADQAAEVRKIVETALMERLKPLERAFGELGARIGTAGGEGVELSVRELSGAMDARLTAFSSEIRQLHSEALAGGERTEERLADGKTALRTSVRDAFIEGSGVFIKHVDAAALDGLERLDVFSKLLVSHIDRLSALCLSANTKLDALDSGAKSEYARMLAAVSALADANDRALRAGLAEAAAAARAENSRQLERIKEAYGLSASGLAAVSSVPENISDIEENLREAAARLKTFMKSLSSVNMEALLGVSGALVRKSFESAGESAAELEKKALALARTKCAIEANISAMTAERKGTVK